MLYKTKKKYLTQDNIKINKSAKMALFPSPQYQTRAPVGGAIFYPRAVIGMSTWYFQWRFKLTGLSVQVKSGSHLLFPVGTILAIFNLLVTPILPIMF